MRVLTGARRKRIGISLEKLSDDPTNHTCGPRAEAREGAKHSTVGMSFACGTRSQHARHTLHVTTYGYVHVNYVY